MKQILQNLKTGTTELVQVPCPSPSPGEILVRTSRSLISAGTERMLTEFGKANLIGKARHQPDKVRMVLDKIRTDGVGPTWASVKNKLDSPLPLGYCNVGRVVGLGADVRAFKLGDRVASNGAHAEFVSVPVNLCAHIPEPVSDDCAAFTVVGAIALQGIRLVAPSLGETIVVTGLGLIGQLTVRLLISHGCRVLGVDPDPTRLALARAAGAEVVSSTGDPSAIAADYSRGRGIDAVIITAATQSSEPVLQAAQMCRKRGRIVLVGVTGLTLSRDEFFKKELTFQVSCSYGPGRYDPLYEQRGQDYPIGYVRWTEQRNFEAVLDALAAGHLDPEPLISHRFSIDDTQAAYDVVGGSAASLGILLNYPAEAEGDGEPERARRTSLTPRAITVPATASSAIAFVGAGSYATSGLIPAFKAAGAKLRTVVSARGVTAVHAGRKFGFEAASTDSTAVMVDPAVAAVVIATRHDSHARLVVEALKAGKHVFVEKPLCLNLTELERIRSECSARPAQILAVGFNRRFSPHMQRIKQLLSNVSLPKAFVFTVNAGEVPSSHWTQDEVVGGGRIIGEACHFIDVLRFLANSPIVGHQCTSMATSTRDTVSIQLQFGDGSIGTVQYLANGSRSFPKERLEVFGAGGILQLDNFKQLRGFGWPGFRQMGLWRQDKGQRQCASAFLAAVQSGGPSPIPLDELFEVARVAIQLARPS